MGYFSNGTEGEMYVDQVCSKCVHNEGCTVMALHMMHNYAECNKPDSFLHVLIPRRENGLGNKKCTMFAAKTASKPCASCQREKTAKAHGQQQLIQEPAP